MTTNPHIVRLRLGFVSLILSGLMAGCGNAETLDSGKVVAPAAKQSRSVESLADTLFTEAMSSGVVVYYDGAKITGIADALPSPGAERVADIDQPMQLGSITKYLASIIAFRLDERGTVALDEPIGRWIGNDAAGEAANVTLAQLLSHRSGIPNRVIEAYQADPSIVNASISMDEAIERFVQGDLDFAPGEAYDYSHSNWIAVKAILERATGQSFADLLEQEITFPLGLTNTETFTGQPKRGLQGLEPGDDGLVIGTPPLPDFLLLAGGIQSSAGDLANIQHALMTGDLLSDAALDRFLTITTEEEDYAYGGRVLIGGTATDPVRIGWHSGSNGPAKTRLISRDDTNEVVAVLCNLNCDIELMEETVWSFLELGDL